MSLCGRGELYGDNMENLIKKVRLFDTFLERKFIHEYGFINEICIKITKLY